MSFLVPSLQLLVTNIINKKVAFQGTSRQWYLVPKLLSLSSFPVAYMVEVLKVLLIFRSGLVATTVSEVL